MSTLSYRVHEVNARRDYSCDLCGLLIRRGERHNLARFLDGVTMRSHLKVCVSPCIYFEENHQ